MLDRFFGLFRRRPAPPRAEPSIAPQTHGPEHSSVAVEHERETVDRGAAQSSVSKIFDAEPVHPPLHDPALLAAVDEFLATVTATDEQRASVPSQFSGRAYLLRNPDVLRARMNPWAHYIAFGRQEGRTW
jgi:hypothetical protein